MLQRIFDDVGDLLFNLQSRGAGIRYEDERRFEREARVFKATDRVQPPIAAEETKDDGEPDRHRTLDARS